MGSGIDEKWLSGENHAAAPHQGFAALVINGVYFQAMKDGQGLAENIDELLLLSICPIHLQAQ